MLLLKRCWDGAGPGLRGPHSSLPYCHCCLQLLGAIEPATRSSSYRPVASQWKNSSCLPSRNLESARLESRWCGPDSKLCDYGELAVPVPVISTLQKQSPLAGSPRTKCFSSQLQDDFLPFLPHFLLFPLLLPLFFPCLPFVPFPLFSFVFCKGLYTSVCPTFLPS